MACFSMVEFIPAVEGYVATGAATDRGSAIQQLYELIG
jgi:hypothetical protein